MQELEYESVLNTALAKALRGYGLDARAEWGQGGGKRIDVEIGIDAIKVALEAEQGWGANKKAEAIKDADGRLRDDLADCAIAVCYPNGLRAGDVAGCEVLHTVRSHKDRPAANKTVWKRDSVGQLVSVIRRIPDQLGDPDNIANRLSFSLDRAVSRLSESQKRDLASVLDLPRGKAMKMEFEGAGSSRYNQAAKRAMLVVATAAMFHAQLDKHRQELWPDGYDGPWPPATASQCAGSEDPVGAFHEAWGLWLVVDYRPIFATARNALEGCGQDVAFTAAVRGASQAAIKVARNIVGLRHDLLGRIFHKVLDTARYDGSFYTTTAAATLLANLAIREDMRDWSDVGAIAGLRITDPACGTGTLLMAAAERIRDLAGPAGSGEVSRALIEQVLTGYDVNLTATHLAATTLGLLSPTTVFSKMKIGRALLGVEDGAAYLGSLEFLSRENQPRLLPWPTGVEQIESAREISEAEPADLVIMNPPFTRDSLRHDQFSKIEELMLKAREKELFEGLATHLSGNSGSFLLLANHIIKANDGTLASVLPAVIATNASGLEVRKFLAKRFYVDTIITSHDPSRIYFSENTSIGEMLLICRRWPRGRDKPGTRVVNLYENPAHPADAISVAHRISNDDREEIKGSVQDWPAERIAAGDWGAVQFLSPYLPEKFVELRNGQLFDTRELGQITEIGPAGRRTHDAYFKSEVPDKNARVALWDHKTSVTQTMLAQVDTYIVPKRAKMKLAESYWAQRGTLMLPGKARLNTVRTLSVRLPQRGLGARWVPCKVKPYLSSIFGQETVEKMICVYLNSTVGILAMLGDRTNKIPSYPQFSLDDLRAITVPDLAGMDREAVLRMAGAYDALCESVLLPLPRMEECVTRGTLDAVVAGALGLDGEVVGTVRRELVREPSVTGRVYDDD